MRQKDKLILREITPECLYECTFCSKDFTRSSDLQAHLVSCEAITKSCSDKGDDNEHKIVLIRNTLQEHDYPCQFCSKVFRHRAALEYHCLSVHAQNRPYKCTSCDKSFVGPRQLANHVRLHTGEKPYSCQLCPKRFRMSHCLRFHLQRHPVQKPKLNLDKRFSCDLCHRLFARKCYLEQHYVACKAAAECHECNICGYFTPKRYLLTLHSKVHSGKRPFRCYLCLKRYGTSAPLRLHLLRKHAGDLHVCKTCAYSSYSKERFSQHVKTHRSPKVKTKRVGLGTPFKRLSLAPKKEYNHKCCFCTEQFSRIEDLNAHLATHGINPKILLVQEKRFKRAKVAYSKPQVVGSAMLRSLIPAKTYPVARQKYYKCDFCPLHFAESTLQEHVRSSHLKQETPIESSLGVCENLVQNQVDSSLIIKESFNTNILLEQFEESESAQPYLVPAVIKQEVNEETDYCSNVDPFADISDGYASINQGSVQDQPGNIAINAVSIPIPLISEDTRYACNLCPSFFRNSTSLALHIRNHKRVVDNAQIYCCQFCPSKFKSSTTLKRHSVVHTGYKPYKCTVCGHTVARKSTLTIHMRTHTGEKPYGCQQCDKTFAQSYHLGSHLRIHTGGTFKCSLCPYSTPRRDHFRQHEKTHGIQTRLPFTFTDEKFFTAMDDEKVKVLICKQCSYICDSDEELCLHYSALHKLPCVVLQNLMLSVGDVVIGAL